MDESERQPPVNPGPPSKAGLAFTATGAAFFLFCTCRDTTPANENVVGMAMLAGALLLGSVVAWVKYSNHLKEWRHYQWWKSMRDETEAEQAKGSHKE